ncbi:MAG TPA: DUF1501 domain-containing protein [Planctomycetota bacterium]|jgi:hypothetical protein|nr:DUF1501 domain-containing protein [Planctomycetota bacterium]
MSLTNCGCSRRDAIRSLVGGSLMLPGILGQLLADESNRDPLAPKSGQHPAKAKRVIFIFLTGGFSHLETFDPKPELLALDGKTTSLGPHAKSVQNLLRPLFDFKPGGTCGTMVSDLFPNIRGVMDDVCLIRSMRSDHADHFQSTLGIHTGSVSFARPSLGSWVSYGLGTFNQNLPSFVVIAPQLPYAGTQIFSNDFLPAYHQGTRVIPGPEPIPNLQRRGAAEEIQEMELGLMHAFNREHLGQRDADVALAARIKSFETAFSMQHEAPEAFDLSKESDATLALYGLERGKTSGFGWQCLVARRMAERGVRFIELIDVGASSNWDAHSDMATHIPLAKNVDRPVAALIQDLKARGMLDDTLVVFTTEFGRTPTKDSPKGRSHHARCFSSWLAGGGVKGGISYGETDDIGANIARDEVHVHDFHATILHLLGLDHTKLTFRHAGRDFRLTDVAGNVVKGILA